jgi:short-subunit dehydrogenase involved in D-alanine esterification of teichoic acids
MSQYKLKSYQEHSESINESILLSLLVPILAVAAGKLIGAEIAKWKGPEIKKSMDNLVKSRFADKAHDSDIKKLYDLIVKEYPDIKTGLDNNDDITLTNDLKKAGLDKDDTEEINKVIDKLRKYHNSL